MNAKSFVVKWFLIPAIIILNTTKLSLADNFVDISPGDTHYVAITYLKEQGTISGYEDNSFKSYENINRVEALKMFMLASGMYKEEDLANTQPANTTIEAPFIDIDTSAWYTKYLTTAKEKGIIQGYEDGTFHPEQTINLAEALKMYLGCFDLIYPDLSLNLYADTPIDAWFTKYTAFAKSRDLLSIQLTNEAHPEQEMTRGYTAEIIYRMTKAGEDFHFGKATFYGGIPQTKDVSKQDSYDLNNLVSAHVTLPFGTIVEVTNLANNKSIKVKITDRGPFGAGRVLDLSDIAFEQIASLSTGVINVQYRVVEN